MYKINTLSNNIQSNTQKNNINSNVNQSDIIHQDIQKMHILPPHCPLYPNGYTDFFNDDKTLKPMSPYKLVSVKHPKDGKIYQTLEYNNFYTDWKKDALKWYPASNIEYENISTNKNSNEPNIFSDSNIKDNNMKLYEQTKRDDRFATPLATNGTNQLNIIFNNKCSGSTFNYKRYASSGINNKEWFNNRLYREDISQETEELKGQYMKDVNQNSMDLYSSVFEDMYILGYEPTDTTQIQNQIQNQIQTSVETNLYSNSINNGHIL